MSTYSYQAGSDNQQTKQGPMRVDAQGNVTHITPAALKDEPQHKPAPTALDVNDRKMAVTIRDGQMTVEHRPNASVQMGKPESSDPLERGRDPKFGQLLARHELTPESIVKIQGIEGDLGGFIKLGLVEKGQDGLYRIAEAKPQQEAQQQQNSTPREDLAPEIEGD